MSHDVIVIGLGGMGSAAAYHLACRGARVLGLDRLRPPHDRGSSHGRSRIIRRAYMEGPAYVPLLRRAYELWDEIEAQTGRTLLRITGGLMLGPEDSQAVAGSVASAREHGLDHELLDAAGIRRRFPPLRPDDATMGVFEPLAGVLDPEAAVSAYLQAAVSAGAEVRTGEVVESWESHGDGYRVKTRGGAFEAGALVLAPGPWAPDLLGDVGRSLVPTREVMHWLAPTGSLDPFLPGRFPVFIWEPAEGAVFYGFPALDGAQGGVKAAIHHGGGPTDAESVPRQVTDADVRAMRLCLSRWVPELDGRHLAGAVCLYTNTPDHHFLLGKHPEADGVALVAGLSGHGFKFASVVGEILTDLALTGATAMPIGPFDPGRQMGG